MPIMLIGDIQAVSLQRVYLTSIQRYTPSMVEGTQRRRAAYVSADVAGHSRLTGVGVSMWNVQRTRQTKLTRYKFWLV